MIRTLTLLITMCLLGCIEQSSPVIDERKIQLTAEEQQFVQHQQQPITWAAEDNRPPFVYKQKDNVQGVSVQYLSLISKKTGLKFAPRHVESFNDGINLVKAGQIDLVTSIRPSAKMMSFFGFTPPYAYMAGVFVLRQNNQPRSPLRAGICNGDTVKDYLVDRFPDMQVISAQDNEEAISLLEKGLIDVVIMNEASVNYLSKRSIIKMRTATADFDYPFSFAFLKENKMLGQVLSKAIASISVEEKKIINESWQKE